MNYREEAIRRAKETGTWDDLTTQSRKTLEVMTDDEAQQFLVQLDENDSDFKVALNSVAVVHAGRDNLAEVFRGEVLNKPMPNRLLLALAELASAAKDYGFSPQEAAFQTAQITREGWSLILAIKAKLSQ